MKKVLILFSFFLLANVGCTVSDPEMMELLQEIKAQNDKLLQEVEAMKRTLALLDGKYQVILASLADNKKELEALKSQIDALKAQIAQQLIKIDQLSAQLTQQGADIIKLSQEIKELKASVEELKGLIEELLSCKSPVPTNGLLGWWPFNGNANDESGNGNNGTVNGAVLTNDRFGNANNAYNFNGLSNEIKITNSFLMLKEDFTVSCWMNSIDISKVQQGIFNSFPHTGFVVELNNENIPPNKLMYGVGNASSYWDLIYAQGLYNKYENNKWYHIVFKKTGTTYTLYVNNLFDGSTVVPASANYTLKVSLTIGSIGGSTFFKGKLDDFAVWNRALTVDEITKIYKGEKF